MKTEKVIEILRSANDIGYGIILEGDTGEIKEALDIAKQAVETGDVYLVGKDINPYLEGYKEGLADYKGIVEENEKLKSEIAKVKRPQGKWKETTHLWETNLSGGMGYDWGYYYACSICSLEVSEKTNFCPHCGASMTKEV